jgi:hypothetical protein
MTRVIPEKSMITSAAEGDEIVRAKLSTSFPSGEECA